MRCSVFVFSRMLFSALVLTGERCSVFVLFDRTSAIFLLFGIGCPILVLSLRGCLVCTCVIRYGVTTISSVWYGLPCTFIFRLRSSVPDPDSRIGRSGHSF